MKKLILIYVLFCSLCVLNSHSQTEKGTYMLGGTGTTGFSFSEGHTSFRLYLTPGFGYFLSDNFVTGARIYLYLNTFEGHTYLNYGITPFARYYFGQGSKIRYFVTGAFGVEGSSSSNGDSSDTNITGNAGVGGVYFLNKSIGLETSLTYHYYRHDESYHSSLIMLSFGFQIYFSR